MVLLLCQGLAYGFGSLNVGFKIGIESVGEEENFQNEENDEEFYQNERPKTTADGHVAETVDVEVFCAFEKSSDLTHRANLFLFGGFFRRYFLMVGHKHVFPL